MGTPGQDLIQTEGFADFEKVRWNRAGIPVEGDPGLITVSDPPDSFEGAAKINSPERVDLVVTKIGRTRLNIKYNTAGEG